MTHSIETIAYLKSPFKEKFGIPRQPGLIKSEDAWIEFIAPYDDPDAVIGLEEFSHIWVSFLFHKNSNSWRPKVRPPRLGGNQKLGVFATRSSFRPNGIGLSLIELKEVCKDTGSTRLRIACPDILDGTPIIDIKPYIQYSDGVKSARSGFASAPPEPKLEVVFNELSASSLADYQTEFPSLKPFIIETLQLDPRPAYKSQSDDKLYGIRLHNFDIKWRVFESCAVVTEVVQIRLPTNAAP